MKLTEFYRKRNDIEVNETENICVGLSLDVAIELLYYFLLTFYLTDVSNGFSEVERVKHAHFRSTWNEIRKLSPFAVYLLNIYIFQPCDETIWFKMATSSKQFTECAHCNEI